MDIWPTVAQLPSNHPPLAGSEGELISIAVSVDPRRLENLLEALAQLPFPVNPQVYHGDPARATPTVVEFPAYSGRLEAVRRILAAHGFDSGSVRVGTPLPS